MSYNAASELEDEEVMEESNTDDDDGIEDGYSHASNYPSLGGKQPGFYVALGFASIVTDIDEYEVSINDESRLEDTQSSGRRNYGGKRPGLYVPPTPQNFGTIGLDEGGGVVDGSLSSQNDQEHSSSEAITSLDDNKTAWKPSSVGKKRPNPFTTFAPAKNVQSTKKAKIGTSRQTPMVSHDRHQVDEEHAAIQTSQEEAASDSSSINDPVQSESGDLQLPSHGKKAAAAVAPTPMPAGAAAFPYMKCDCCRKKKIQKECQWKRMGQSCRQCQYGGATCKINDQPVSRAIWPAWKLNNPTIASQADYAAVAPIYVEADPGDRKGRGARKGE